MSISVSEKTSLENCAGYRFSFLKIVILHKGIPVPCLLFVCLYGIKNFLRGRDPLFCKHNQILPQGTKVRLSPYMITNHFRRLFPQDHVADMRIDGENFMCGDSALISGSIADMTSAASAYLLDIFPQ